MGGNAEPISACSTPTRRAYRTEQELLNPKGGVTVTDNPNFRTYLLQLDITYPEERSLRVRQHSGNTSNLLLDQELPEKRPENLPEFFPW